MNTEFNGLLLIDKPAGWTSFDVVAKVRGLLSTELRSIHAARGFCIENQAQTNRCKCKVRVGHTGTLDPAATGVLVLALGSYTKKIEGLMKRDKTYEAELTFGATSTTEDGDGEITQTNQPIPDENTIISAIESFIGEIEQAPPIYSAIKVNGVRAYKLAREGKEPEMKLRKATVNSIESIQITNNKATFVVDVSSGTYIRSLARDIGEKLGCGAYMSALRRTRVGEFSIQDTQTISELNIERIQASIITLE